MESDLLKDIGFIAARNIADGAESADLVDATRIRAMARCLVKAADELSRRDEATVVVPSVEAVRLAEEFVADPDERAQVKVHLCSVGLEQQAALIDEAVVMARELLRLAAAQGEGKP